MQVEFTEDEALAVQRIVDAALRGDGIAILSEAHWLQVKLKTAFEQSKRAGVEQ